MAQPSSATNMNLSTLRVVNSMLDGPRSEEYNGHDQHDENRNHGKQGYEWIVIPIVGVGVRASGFVFS